MDAKWIAIIAVGLAACASEPKPVDPPLVQSALAAESEGAKRYVRGEFAVAERRFVEASRLFASIDDVDGDMRNRLHLVRTQLAQGRSEKALELLDAMRGATATKLQVRILTGQAQLALARYAEADAALADAALECAGTCAAAASIAILQGRAALARAKADTASALSSRALELLGKADDANETGNAWRLRAAAMLALRDTESAMAAAQNALGIDRRLALPEKIARDWLLIGDIRRQSAGQSPTALAEVATAYRRALEVARAAGIEEISRLASQELKAICM